MIKALALAASLFFTSAFAMAANPSEERVTRVVNRSVILKNTLSGVKKSYGFTKCSDFTVKSYARKEGAITASATCTITDEWGDGSGVIIDVDGAFWDNDTFMVTKIEFTFAG